MRRLLTLASLTFLLGQVNTEFVPDTEQVEPSEIFDLVDTNTSTVRESDSNTKYYYCIFRSLWTDTDHPTDYPDRPRYTPPVLFSHTKQYAPFVQNRQASSAVEGYAKVRHNCVAVLLLLLLSMIRLYRFLMPCFPHSLVPRTALQHSIKKI